MRERSWWLLLSWLCLAAVPGLAQEGAHWRAMAREDLEFVVETITADHPGPMDRMNPAFESWMEEGYREAVARLPEVKGYGSHQHLLRFFVNGFADAHLNVSFWLEYRWQRWTGIVLAWNGESFVVHHVAADVDLEPGAVLVGCDGRSAEALWMSHVLPFYGRADLPADRFREAPRLLLSNSNPMVEEPSICRFRLGNEERALELSWRGIATPDLREELETAVPGGHDPLGIREFGENGVWISLPSFGVRGKEAERMKAVMAELEEHRDAEILVVDVRGNGGGSSWWGELFVRRLHGDGYYERLDHEESARRPDLAVDYRVSAANLRHFEELRPVVLEQAGEESEMYRHFDDLVDGMARALENGATFHTVRDEPSEDDVVPPVVEPAYTGRVIYLTDSLCVSACLDFSDLIFLLPRVTHVGQPTNADTPYMEIRGLTLPSGIGRFNFATKVYRGDRGRGPDGYYTPEYEFVGDISDTAAVETWLREVVLRGERPDAEAPPRKGGLDTSEGRRGSASRAELGGAETG